MNINDASFWVFAAFLILLFIIGKSVWNLVAGALDSRSQEIATKIEDASRMREEALALLNTCKRQHIEASEHASSILAHAEEEAERLRQKALRDTEKFMEIEERLFQERLRQAEEKALEEIREKAILVAGDAVRSVLQEKISTGSTHGEQKNQFQAFCKSVDTFDLSPKIAV